MQERVKHLEVRHLQLVTTIVELGSVTRASQRLNVTQSALSHQLLDIERRLGIALFHRDRKRMTLTDAGQRLLVTARGVLRELGQTEEDLERFADHRRGLIRLTTECYTVYHWLPAAMKTFKKKYPDVEIRIDVNATDAPYEALIAGAIDIAFVTSEKMPRGIASVPLFRDEMKVIVAPGHPFAKLRFVTPKALAQETLLTYSSLHGNAVYERVLRPAGFEPKRHLQVRLTEAIIELVRAETGVAVLAQWAAAPYVASGSVVAVRLGKRGLARHWRAAHLATRPISPFVRAFVETVANHGPSVKK